MTLFAVLLDSDGWLDVLGSGRLRKRTVVEGDTSHGHKPRNGQTVKIHKKGEIICILHSLESVTQCFEILFP